VKKLAASPSGCSRVRSNLEQVAKGDPRRRTRRSVLGRLPDPVPLENIRALGPLLSVHLPDVAALRARPRLALLRPPGRSSHRGCAVVLVHNGSLRRQAVESSASMDQTRQRGRRESPPCRSTPRESTALDRGGARDLSPDGLLAEAPGISTGAMDEEGPATGKPRASIRNPLSRDTSGQPTAIFPGGGRAPNPSSQETKEAAIGRTERGPWAHSLPQTGGTTASSRTASSRVC
jgi:hypothetical protein